MPLEVEKYVKKPLYADAVKVTEDNFHDVAEWCSGKISRLDVSGADPVRFIKVRTHKPISERQTRVYVGDYVLKTDRGFKVYTEGAFERQFDRVVEVGSAS